MLKRQSNSTSLHTLFRRTEMLIENLSKDLDTKTMTDVRGGVALTGQVVPTNLQSNEMNKIYNISSKGPVPIANEGSQKNFSSQDSPVPVGSVVGFPFEIPVRTLVK